MLRFTELIFLRYYATKSSANASTRARLYPMMFIGNFVIQTGCLYIYSDPCCVLFIFAGTRERCSIVSWLSVDGRVGVLSDDDYWPTMSSQLSVSHYYYDYYCRLRWSAVTGSDVYSLNIARPTTKPVGCCCQCCLGCSQHSVGQERGKTHDNQEQKSWMCLYRWWWFGALHVLQLQLSPPPPSSL